MPPVGPGKDQGAHLKKLQMHKIGLESFHTKIVIYKKQTKKVHL